MTGCVVCSPKHTPHLQGDSLRRHVVLRWPLRLCVFRGSYHHAGLPPLPLPTTHTTRPSTHSSTTPPSLPAAPPTQSSTYRHDAEVVPVLSHLLLFTRLLLFLLSLFLCQVNLLTLLTATSSLQWGVCVCEAYSVMVECIVDCLWKLGVGTLPLLLLPRSYNGQKVE